MSISEIEEQLSINDQSYFAREFKQLTGISAYNYCRLLIQQHND